MANLCKATKSIGKFSPESSMLFLCDMQVAFSAGKFFPQIVYVSNRLLKAFKILSCPIICTEHSPTDLYGSTVPELGLSANEITAIGKTTFSMCVPEVQKMLEEKRIKSVFICGVEAHICVQNTVFDLLEKGIEVHVVVDAVSSRSMVDRMYAFERMREAGAFLTTSESVIYGLVGGTHHPKFKEVQMIALEPAPDTGLLRPTYS